MKYRRHIRDNKKRILYKKTEVFQRLLKVLYVYMDVLLLKIIVQKNFFFKQKKNSFKVRIKNFCVLSGRSRGINRQFRISRICLRIIGSSGLFFGLKKHSW